MVEHGFHTGCHKKEETMAPRLIALMFTSMLLVSGCASKPQTAFSPVSIEGSKVIYFEQSDRIPKDVLLASHGKEAHDPAVRMMAAVPPEVYAAMIEELVGIIPDMSKVYSNERMNNALLGRRILFRGYAADELIEVEKIIRAMNETVEYITPQGKLRGAFPLPAKIERQGDPANDAPPR